MWLIWYSRKAWPPTGNALLKNVSVDPNPNFHSFFSLQMFLLNLQILVALLLFLQLCNHFFSIFIYVVLYAIWRNHILNYTSKDPHGTPISYYYTGSCSALLSMHRIVTGLACISLHSSDGYFKLQLLGHLESQRPLLSP